MLGAHSDIGACGHVCVWGGGGGMGAEEIRRISESRQQKVQIKWLLNECI